MNTMELDVLNHSWNLGFATGRVQAVRMDLHERYRHWRRYRRMVAELRQYSSDELADLGIAPSDTGRITREAAYR